MLAIVLALAAVLQVAALSPCSLRVDNQLLSPQHGLDSDSVLSSEHVLTVGVVDAERPRLSWKLCSGPSRGDLDRFQAAYRVALLRKDFVDQNSTIVWDSGRVESASQLNMPLLAAGQSLPPLTRFQVNLTVWGDTDGMGHDASGGSTTVGLFETALMCRKTGEKTVENDCWRGARWVRRNQRPPTKPCQFYEDDPAPLLRSPDVALLRPLSTLAAARLYITGLGYYVAFLNGARVGASQLDPAWTSYNETVLYAAYNVTEMLLDGADTGIVALGLMLGRGWWKVRFRQVVFLLWLTIF
jgi:alpha-L-rhamnosidase